MALEALDAGVHVWLERPAGAGRPNAGVVVDAEAVSVIDTLMVPEQWEPFATEVESFGPPVRNIVLTSSGIEHCGGTGRLKLAAIYGRRQASVHLDQPPVPDVWRALYPEHAAAFDEVATRPVSHIVDTDVQLTPAITLVVTSGQQAENLVAVVPGAAVCFAGAMCSFGVTPLCFQGDPARWADELDRIADLAPVIVPGHGPVGGEEELRELQSYLRACVAAAGDPTRLPPGPWDTWNDRHHDEVNVERAAMLARGHDAIPSSMLRAAGLA
jgi:glyoxylase-like metal-dependent hydrolase (beta-lactamase superfamily II)